MRNESEAGKSPMEVIMRKRKPNARVESSNAGANRQSMQSLIQLSETVSNNPDSSNTARQLNHRTHPRRSVRNARNKKLLQQRAMSNQNPTLPTEELLDVVKEALAKNKETKTKNERKKRGEYHRYTPETREAIAQHAIENGTGSAAKTFSTSLG